LSSGDDAGEVDRKGVRSLSTQPWTLEAGPDQIQRINLLEGNNARHVQALYRREIDE